MLGHAGELGNKAHRGENVSLVNVSEAKLRGFDRTSLLTDVTIDNLELTQAIQCIGSTVVGCEGGDNSLPLATNRSTAVRVYLRFSGPQTLFTSIADVPVRLYVLAGSGAGAEVFTLDSAGTAVKFPERTNATHSANFFLSIDGPGDIPVRMCAVIDPDDEIAESDESNNRFPQSGSVEKLFEARRSIETDAIPVASRVNAGDAAHVPNQSHVATQPAVSARPARGRLPVCSRRGARSRRRGRIRSS